MATRILTHISKLVHVRDVNPERPVSGQEMGTLPEIENAWLLIEDGHIADFGSMHSIIPNLPAEQVNCSGKIVLPAWCDSHTHLVFAGSRENEFVDKLKGLTYAEINARGGGILSTVQQISQISEDELFRISWNRLEEIARLGTGAVEIKSGYGLSLNAELKMLRVIKRLKEKSPVEIKSTFLGAHTFPVEFRENHPAYIHSIVHEMLPAIAKEGLADYIDVFCENGFFNPEESETILRAGFQHGLKAKMHVNQLNSIGGIKTGIALDAISMDHLETMTIEDIDLIRNSEWKGLCTLLPTAAYFLRLGFPPARLLIDAGSSIALATDYNPGSSPSGNMNTVISMACIQMKMLPEEAINAATINGAFAMELEKTVGSITKGKNANLIVTAPVPSIAYLPYRFGSNLIDKVILRGEFVA